MQLVSSQSDNEIKVARKDRQIRQVRLTLLAATHANTLLQQE